MSGDAGPVYRPLEPEDAGALAALWEHPDVNACIAWTPGEDALAALQDNGRWLGAWVGDALVAVAHLAHQSPARRHHTCLLDWTCRPTHPEGGEVLLVPSVTLTQSRHFTFPKCASCWIRVVLPSINKFIYQPISINHLNP